MAATVCVPQFAITSLSSVKELETQAARTGFRSIATLIFERIRLLIGRCAAAGPFGACGVGAAVAHSATQREDASGLGAGAGPRRRPAETVRL